MYYASIGSKTLLSSLFSPANKDKITINKAGGETVMQFKDDERLCIIKLDNKTMVPFEIENYVYIDGNPFPTMKYSLGNYVTQNGYRVPTKIKQTANFRGTSLVMEFEIDPKSIEFNKEVANNIEVRTGAMVYDSIEGKNYVVTEVDNFQQKEDIIKGVLDNLLDQAEKQKDAQQAE